MGGASPTYLTANVAPNGSIDVTVAMTAPATVGTYTGNWGLYSNTGIFIGPVWVTDRCGVGLTQLIVTD